MERLTLEGNFCEIARCKEVKCPYDTDCSQKQIWERLKQYEDTKRTPEQIEALEAAIMGKAVAQITEFEGLPIARLRELAVADKDGRCVVPPCKVGDMVWVIAHPWTGKLQKKPLVAYVNGMKLFTHGLYVNVLFDTLKINGTRDYGIISIGKTVFLTREEAEKELAEMEGKA